MELKLIKVRKVLSLTIKIAADVLYISNSRLFASYLLLAWI
jgi:hypothetical protein